MYRIAIALSVVLAGMSVPRTAEAAEASWQEIERTGNWTVSILETVHAGSPLLRFTYPKKTASAPPERSSVAASLPVPDGARAVLHFQWKDSFTGDTEGYHSLQVRVDGTLVFEKDVAYGALQPYPAAIDITAHCQGNERIPVTVTVTNKKRVTNFGVNIEVSEISIRPEERETIATAARPLPADLPLPALPTNGLDWTTQATVLQPWGRTQYDAMYQCPELPAELAEDYGFNTLIVLPPGAYRYTAPADKPLTEDDFRKSLDAYRKAGYRILLYSSLMHVGHSESWEDGTVEREHPDWAQRDAYGGTIRKYGHPWLCPSSPALQYAIDYTLGIVEQYQPDGVMLDNNQFYHTINGHTCYCTYCQNAFRNYVATRFGDSTTDFFGSDAANITIPTQDGPLKNLWIHWRNRAWVEANDAFRTALRKAQPDIMFFANTQYYWKHWELANNLQLRHEDVVLSESRSLSSAMMSGKMLLGQAMAGERPVWNYIGTFEDTDITQLRDPHSVSRITAATIAHQACPWIVYYGFDRDDAISAGSQQVLSDLLRFRAAHPDFYTGLTPSSPVATLFSPRSRDYQGTSVLPQHLEAVQRAGYAPRGLSAMHINRDTLASIEYLLAEQVVSVEDDVLTCIAEWIDDGGTLIGTPDFGTCNAIGVQRADAPDQIREAMVRVEGAEDFVTVLGKTSLPRFQASFSDSTDRFLECCAYEHDDGRLILHLVNHGERISAPWQLTLPANFIGAQGSLQLYLPGEVDSIPLSFEKLGKNTVVLLPPMDAYGVIVFRK